MYVGLLGQKAETGEEVKDLYMGISGDISNRLRNHIKHQSRIPEQKINGKINTEITSEYTFCVVRLDNIFATILNQNLLSLLRHHQG